MCMGEGVLQCNDEAFLWEFVKRDCCIICVNVCDCLMLLLQLNIMSCCPQLAEFILRVGRSKSLKKCHECALAWKCW